MKMAAKTKTSDEKSSRIPNDSGCRRRAGSSSLAPQWIGPSKARTAPSKTTDSKQKTNEHSPEITNNKEDPNITNNSKFQTSQNKRGKTRVFTKVTNSRQNNEVTKL